MSDPLRDLSDALRARAVDVVRGGKHLRVEKDGKLLGTLPNTPGEYRGLTNARLQLERAGVLPRERQQTGSKRGRRKRLAARPYDGPLYPEGRRPRPKREEP